MVSEGLVLGDVSRACRATGKVKAWCQASGPSASAASAASCLHRRGPKVHDGAGLIAMVSLCSAN